MKRKKKSPHSNEGPANGKWDLGQKRERSPWNCLQRYKWGNSELGETEKCRRRDRKRGQSEFNGRERKVPSGRWDEESRRQPIFFFAWLCVAMVNLVPTVDATVIAASRWLGRGDVAVDASLEFSCSGTRANGRVSVVFSRSSPSYRPGAKSRRTVHHTPNFSLISKNMPAGRA